MVMTLLDLCALDPISLNELIADLGDELQATVAYLETIRGVDAREQRETEAEIADLRMRLRKATAEVERRLERPEGMPYAV